MGIAYNAIDKAKAQRHILAIGEGPSIGHW